MYFSNFFSKIFLINSLKKKFPIVYKTKAVKCVTCNGEGYIRKVKKDGSLYSKPNRCVTCETH